MLRRGSQDPVSKISTDQATAQPGRKEDKRVAEQHFLDCEAQRQCASAALLDFSSLSVCPTQACSLQTKCRGWWWKHADHVCKYQPQHKITNWINFKYMRSNRRHADINWLIPPQSYSKSIYDHMITQKSIICANYMPRRKWRPFVGLILYSVPMRRHRYLFFSSEHIVHE